MIALAETWALLFYRRETVVVNDYIFFKRKQTIYGC